MSQALCDLYISLWTFKMTFIYFWNQKYVQLPGLEVKEKNDNSIDSILKMMEGSQVEVQTDPDPIYRLFDPS